MKHFLTYYAYAALSLLNKRRFLPFLLLFIPPSLSAFMVTVTPCQNTPEQETLSPHEHSIKESLTRSPFVTLKGNTSAGSLQQISFYGLPSSSSAVLYEELLLNMQNSGGVNFASLESVPVCHIKFLTNSPHAFYQGPGLIEIQGLNLNRLYPHHIGAEVSSLGAITSHASSIHTLPFGHLGIMASGTLDDGLPQYGAQRIRGEKNAYQTGSIGLKSAFSLTPDWTLGLLAHHKKDRLKTDGLTVTPLPQDEIIQEIDLGKLSLTYEGNASLTHHLWLGGYQENNTYLQSTPFHNKFKSLQTGYQLIHTLNTSTTKALIHYTQDTYTQGTDKTQGHGRLFLEHIRALTPELKIELAALVEKVFSQKTTVSPQSLIAWDINPQWHASLSYKIIHRFPTLLEKNGITSTQTANPLLKPETGHLIQADLEWDSCFWASYLRLFHTRIHNAIQSRLVGSGIYQKINATLGTQGFIIGATWSKDKVTLGGHYTFTASHRKNTQALAHGISKHKAQGLFTYHFKEDLALKNTLKFYSSTPSQRFSGGRAISVKLKPYALFQSTLTYTPTQNTTLYLEGRNLFNKRYQTVADYRTAGRSIHVGIHGRF